MFWNTMSDFFPPLPIILHLYKIDPMILCTKHGAKSIKWLSHQENGAKLKKETQCPCTYKNKLILLCVQSLSTFFFCLVLKIHTHKLRLHWLSFTPAWPITITYVHQRPMRNSLCTLNEVKTVPLNSTLTHFLPSTNSYIQPHQPPNEPTTK